MLTDVSVFSAVKRLRWMWKQICSKSAPVTLGVLWRPHRAEAPEVTAQWRANWFSYRINRSARQSQAKLMARVFSSALLGKFAWRCHPDTGAPAEQQGEILKNSSSYTAMTFMKTSAKVALSPFFSAISQTLQFAKKPKSEIKGQRSWYDLKHKQSFTLIQLTLLVSHLTRQGQINHKTTN